MMEAMFAQHNPLVFGQPLGHQFYNCPQRPRRPCSLHLTHSISLSVQEKVPTESKSHDKRSSSNCVTESENARRLDSSPSSELRVQSHRHFHPETELNKDKEDDLDRHDFHKNCKNSFFQLCGDLKQTQDNATGDTIVSWPNLKVLRQGMGHGEPSWLQHCRDNRETPVLMDCEEKDWPDDNYYESTVSSEQLGSYGYGPGKAFSDCGSSSQEQNDYISDSSCNSSDGVLVNFSAIYNKTNNAVPATPYDLDSPAMNSPSHDDNSIPYGSPCRVDPNCNVYQVDSNSLSSLEISDLTDCLENQGRPFASTNSYYKLVSCDLSSQSPTSPVWSTVTSCSEPHSQRSSTPPTEYFLFRKPEGEEEDQQDLQADSNSELQRNMRNIRNGSKGTTERNIHNQMHQTKCRDSELNCYEDSQETPTRKPLPRAQRCPNQPTFSWDAPEPPKTSFAELARYKKSNGDLTALKNNREASSCFQLNQNQKEKRAHAGQNVTLLEKQNDQDLESPQRIQGKLQKESHQHSDSSSLTDGPPEEFCLSPDACTEFLSIDLLQKKDILKSVSLVVDLITTHFNTKHHEKIRPGSSSQCPSITKLVLDQLCPAIRNLLQDGLRSFTLDLIVGQRRIKAWSVVEAFTQPGPSNHMLHSLLSVIRKCPKLTNHNMRLNAFFMGLLNLSALGSWFCHLHACDDVITKYYHPWAFLALSQGLEYKFLYQEFLHILEPLSQLPFNLHLLSESKLQGKLNQTQQSRPPSLSVCAFPWRPNIQKKGGCTERQVCRVKVSEQSKILEDKQQTVSVCSSQRKCAGWWLSQASTSESLYPPGTTDIRNEILMDSSERTSRFSLRSQEEKPPTEWRWARLFGSGIGEKRGNVNQNPRARPPSQWIKLGASKMDLLTQSVWSRDTTRALCQ